MSRNCRLWVEFTWTTVPLLVALARPSVLGAVVDAMARNHARHVSAMVSRGGGSAVGDRAVQPRGHRPGEATGAAESTHVQGHAGTIDSMTQRFSCAPNFLALILLQKV